MSDSGESGKQPTAEECEGVFRAIFEQTAVGVAQLASKTGAFVRINRRYAELVGYTVAEMEQLTFQEITHPEDLPEDLANMQRLLAGEIREFSMVKRYYHKDGSIVWGNLTVSPMWEVGEEPSFHMAVVEDITERKRAEAALRESESSLQEAQQMACLGNWTWNVQTGSVQWSDEVYHIFRLDPNEFTPQIGSIMEFSPWPEEHERDKELIERAIASREQGSYEQRFLRPDGKVGHYFSTFQGIYDDDGSLTAMRGTVQDITERKRVVDELRESEQRLSILFEQAADAIYLSNLSGRLIQVNEEACRSTGYTEEELLCLNITDVDAEHTTPDQLRAFFDTLSSGSPTRIESRHRRKGGSVFPVEITIARLETPDGVRFLGIARDITERKRAEAALRESQETYRALVEGLPDIVMRFDRDGRHLFVSENVEQVVDVPAAQFAGKTHRDLGFPEDMCRFWEDTIRTVFDSGAPSETEFSFEGSQGRSIHNWRLVPECSPRGTVRSVLSISRDITEYRRVQQDYQTLFREMLNGFALHEIICDEQGHPTDYRFLAVNPAFERLTGLKAEDLVGKTVLEAMPNTEKHWIEAFGRVALSGETVHFENYSQELEKHYTVTAFQPAPRQFACIFADITDRKQTEEALRESEERLRTVAQTMPVLVDAFDEEQHVIVWNRECERVTGYSAEEIVGNPHAMSMLYPDPEYREWVMATVHKAEGDFRNLKFAITSKTGEARTVLWSNLSTSHPISGWATWAVGIDITDYERSERALRESEARHRQLINTMSDGLAIAAPDGSILFVNPPFCRMYGYSEEELIGMHATRLIHPEYHGVFRQFLEDLAETGKFWGETVDVRKDGTTFENDVRGARIQFAGQDCLLAMVRDVTDRKHAEREREELIAKLEAQNAELERFTYTVSHDLKSPLITIKGYIGLLSEDLREAGTDSVMSDLERIARAADKMGVLLEDLLELSRIGRLANPPEVVSLGKMAHDALELLHGQLEDKLIRVEVLPNLPEVHGDRTRLREVLQNLIDNAVKYMGDQPQPRIEIGARQDGGETICYVRDNGIGIEPPYHDKVFGLFDQLDPAMEGTGVGLALVKRIVEVHGGRIWIESEGRGSGSTFCFTLPEATKEC